MPRRRFYRTKKRKRSVFVTLLKVGLGMVLALLVLGTGAFILFAKDLPDPSRIEERFVSQSTKIYDRSGKIILYDIHGEEKRTLVPFSEIPQSVKAATIAIEDQSFYNHFGIDLKAILRAFLSNLRGDRIQGGSTITQQFIKNSILSPERTLTRKIKEAILAVELERKYTKDEIFGFYLNQIAYGSNAYGIEAAAQTFFSKQAKDLTLAESALLAAVTKAPTYYSPYGSHPEELNARKNYVLEQMESLGFISKEESEEARREKLELSQVRTAINAPHFVFYVRGILEAKYGKDYLARAGLRVFTTLDSELQELAEEVVLEGALRNEASGAFNAALVAIDPKTGQIIAMVGSRDYFEDPKPEGCNPGLNCKFEPNVNVAIRDRQPGSALKPFIYATAFKKGYTDNTILLDIPTEFNSSCDQFNRPLVSEAECYHPVNYDEIFRGPVTVRTALANSINVPSVKFLYLAGVNDSINTAQDMGITTLKDRSRFGLSLVLGGGEVKLLDITSAFGVFATEGVRHPPTVILRIEDGKGNVLEEFSDQPSQVIDSEITRLISDILSDNNARIPVFGANSPLYFPDRDVAAKTGTTNEFRDGWTIGYTPSIVVGVWAGNNDNTPTNRKPGLVLASPIWREFLIGAFEKLNLPPESFTPPEPREGSKPVLNGSHIVNGEIHTILYYLTRDDPLGSATGKEDSLFTNWEAAVQKWFNNSSRPQSFNIVITSPNKGEEVNPTAFNIEAIITSAGPVRKAEFFFDGVLMGTITGAGPLFRFPVNLPLGVLPGTHTAKIRVFGETPTTFSEKSIEILIGGD